MSSSSSRRESASPVSDVRKKGYLRKLKGRFSCKQPLAHPSSALRGWENVREFIDAHLKCRPLSCKCARRRVLLRIFSPWDTDQTMKKKFFVLKNESENQPARLEYYDNEKKWKLGSPPKRSIILKTCFNINRKLDTKHKHALALFTKDDCFTVVLDNDDELDSWLRALLELQQGDDEQERNEPLKPSFEHIWEVNVRNRGLASTKNILGNYHLCLTSQVLSLVKLNTETPEIIEFPLMSIRRCGHSYCFFFMELGRSAVTGAGELWMQTEDVIIAQNMHEAILNAMRTGANDEITPRTRTRSSSTNESSKPITVQMRRQTTVCVPSIIPGSRERSDSVPSRPRTISDSPSEFGNRLTRPIHLELQRPHSMFDSSSFSCHKRPKVNSPGSSSYIIGPSGNSVGSEEHEPLQFEFYPSHSMDAHDIPMLDKYLPMTPPDTNKGSFKATEHGDDGYMDMTSPNSLPPTGLFSRSRTPSTTNSPNVGSLNNMGKVIPIPFQGDYLEMVSPTSNSPADPEGYMQMSSLGSSLPNVTSKFTCATKPHRTGSTRSSSGTSHNRKTSIDNTRKTSVDESSHDGYIPMTPLSGSLKSPTDDGYLEMSALRKAKDDSQIGSPAVSDASSAELRFSEFQLEKVTAYFTPNEEEKLVRAYSVGSKTAASLNKNSGNQLDVCHADSSRVRAFSVGSKVGLRFGHKVVSQTTTENKDKKSLSAPLLGVMNQSFSGTSLLNTGSNKPKQSEDLMELDFAKAQKSSSIVKSMPAGKRSDDILLLRTPDWSTNPMRPRSNSRSSSCPSKGESLQVIGEKADVVNRDFIQNEEANPAKKFTPATIAQNADIIVKNSASLDSAHNISRSPNLLYLVSQREQFRSSCLPADAASSTSGYVNVDMNKQIHRKYSGLKSTVARSSNCNPANAMHHSKASSVSIQNTEQTISTDPAFLPVPLDNTATDLQNNLGTAVNQGRKLDMVKQLQKSDNSKTLNSETPTVTASQLTALKNDFAECNKLELLLTKDETVKDDKDHSQQSCQLETPYENIVYCTKELNSSRPASVGSECELNYASLDLATTAVENDAVSLLLHDLKSGNVKNESENQLLSYASIDFTKSEGLRHTSVMRNSTGKQDQIK